MVENYDELDKIYRNFLTPEEVNVVENEDLIFQAISWYDGDFEKKIEITEDNVDEDIKLEYKIFIHGVNQLGQSVCAIVNDFTPYFYVEIPDDWDKRLVNMFYKFLKSKLGNMSYGLVGSNIVKKEKLYPYLGTKKFNFVRLIFNNMKTLRRCNYIFKEPVIVDNISRSPIKFEVFESNVQPLNRFCHIQDVLTAGWIKIKKEKFSLLKSEYGNYEPDDISRAQIVGNVYWKDVKPYDKHDIAPLVIFSWDIECHFVEDDDPEHKFPNPRLDCDTIAQIGIVVWKYGSKKEEEIHKIIITDRPCSLIEGITVIACKGEKELLKTFFNLIESIDPDVLTGYNTWGFDDTYVWVRAMGCECPREKEGDRKGLFKNSVCKEKKCWKGHGLENSVDKVSRLTQIKTELKERTLSSGAYGDNTFYTLETHGRETLDLLISIRRDHKLESYKLDNVAYYFTKQKKEDLPYNILFKKLKSGPDDVAICARYCVQDSNLVIKLVNKLAILPNYIEMAKATYVPMGWLLFRGQQCKVFSLTVKEAREKGYVVPISLPSENRKFTGATVLNPLRGAYYSPVAGLDFASLYPSIMIAFNLCYSTIVLDKKYMNLKGVKYETIEWTVDDEENGKQEFSVTFVQEPEEEFPNGVKGVLPTILERLWNGRKATKKLMKSEKDPFMVQVLNGKQLAQKVTMNSVYGFTGTGEKGMLPCKAIAASVTAKGREMIDKTKQIAEETYPGCIALYGDSIPGYEKVIVKKFNPDVTKEMIILEKRVDGLDNLFNCGGSGGSGAWKEYPLFKSMPKDRDEFINVRMDKQYFVPEEQWMTKTHKGWSPIQRVIRHKVDGKKLIKIKARTIDKNGEYIIKEVIVTEGHSLIDENGRLIEAGDLKVGTKLLV